MTTIWPMPAAVAPLPTVSASSTATATPSAASAAHAAPTMPPPIISTSTRSATADPLPERVALVEQQPPFQGDVGCAGDARAHLIAVPCVARREAAADDALLHPRRAGRQ